MNPEINLEILPIAMNKETFSILSNNPKPDDPIMQNIKLMKSNFFLPIFPIIFPNKMHAII